MRAEPSLETPARPAGFARALAQHHLERGSAFEKRDDAALALTEYSAAIAIDANFAEAYLRLGALRERIGDAREAEVVYSRAATLPDGRAPALRARAELRLRQGQDAEALSDLEASLGIEPNAEASRELVALYVKARAWPAALAVSRRLFADAQRANDESKLDAARLEVRALSVLAGEADAIVTTAPRHDWVRRALASIARRGGSNP